MSLLFIEISDFIGQINLDLSSDSNVIAQFEAFGRDIEEEILKELLNDKLYSDLIADLDGNEEPQTQIYIDLVNGKEYTNPIGQTIIYEGLKKMLRFFIYEEYLDFIYSQNTSTGQMSSQNENSIPLTRGQLRKVRSRIQNKAVKLYHKAAIFINDNYTDYFTGTDYAYWRPKEKRFLGKITTSTYSNSYFYNRSSEDN